MSSGQAHPHPAGAQALRPHLRAALLLALLTALAVLLLGSPVQGQALTVPTDIQQPGTQPGEVTALQAVSKCDNCHGGYDAAVEPTHGWRGGMMAHATRDPLFWATVAIAEQDVAGSGDLCLRCHTPDGCIEGASTPTDGSALTDALSQGVGCDLCHRLTNPDQSEWLGIQHAPFLAHDGGSPPEGYYGSGQFVVALASNIKYGPYADVDPNHGFLQSRFHRSAEVCGTCHDVSNPAVGDLAPFHGAQIPLAAGSYSGVPGAPVEDKAAFNNPPYAYGVVERTFSEHQASAWATLAVSDHASLPAELLDGGVQRAIDAALLAGQGGDYADGTTRTFTCQTCHMRPTIGKGADKPAVPTRADLPLHDQTGGSTWIGQAMVWLDDRGKLVTGGGLSTAERAALDDGADRARQTLAEAAALRLDGDTLTVVNLTGHKLLSGYPEGRRAWLNVQWYDDADVLLREDGAYGPLQVTVNGQPYTVDSLLDLHDEHSRLYAAHPGVSQEWAARLVSLGWSASLPVAYDRLDGSLTLTLGDVAAMAPGTAVETFHFVLLDTMLKDARIPPYGFAYDEAARRNILPVPADLYGDPGPGGVYEHFDEVDLEPPTGAVRADIRLLYQSTSWEFVQFLLLANDGSVAFLADTGQDLFDAWLATGMAPPEVMAETQWFGDPSPWSDLGLGLAGSDGVPELEGFGSLQPLTSYGVELSHALVDSPSWLVIGFQAVSLPFKGGTLVPDPTAPGVVLTLPTGPLGGYTLTDTWPDLVPAGVELYLQSWIVDPAGPVGLAASNALRAVTP